MKILHFAVENYARVPANLVKAERKLGHESYLITLYHTFQGYGDEDICLEMPFVATNYITFLKRFFSPTKTQVTNLRKDAKDGVPVWKPTNGITNQLFKLRDRLWENKIRRVLDSLEVESFDLLFLDGGAGFLRSAKIVRELKEKGLRIIICYCGSDLRTRGIIPAVEEIADHRFTFEFDHTLYHPELEFMYFPFELVDFNRSLQRNSTKIRIGHAPTSRSAKGTDEILKELNPLREKYQVEIVLIENLPHQDALTLKASCDIFVDTIGELGYGINSLESLAMGIPTAVQILPDFEAVLGEHPFINISRQTIAEKLVPLIESGDFRKEFGGKGKRWVEENHDPLKVSRTVLSCIQN